eukprot:COSAG02_NODE_1643_length_11528_cov_19.259865_11_plen_37_part_00
MQCQYWVSGGMLTNGHMCGGELDPVDVRGVFIVAAQ